MIQPFSLSFAPLFSLNLKLFKKKNFKAIHIRPVSNWAKRFSTSSITTSSTIDQNDLKITDFIYPTQISLIKE
jgi:hypothetical protein